VFLLGSEHLLEESTRISTIALPWVKRNWLRRLWFDLVSGRRLIRALKPDVLFSLQNTYTHGIGCPQVIYVHQSLPFQRVVWFSFWRRDERLLAIYQRFIGLVIKRSIRSAEHVVVQTRWMRDAIVDQVGIAGDRIEWIHPDLDDLSIYESAEEYDPRAFFYPSTDHLYKNNGCAYQACRLLREQGVSDFRVTITTKTISSEPNVLSIGPIARGRALEILSRSTLVYPSLFESYGLPLAEARALDVLVLAADCPYAREVLEGYANAYYFDPASPIQLAALMRRVISGGIKRAPSPRSGDGSCRETRVVAWARVVDILEGHGRRGLPEF